MLLDRVPSQAVLKLVVSLAVSPLPSWANAMPDELCSLSQQYLF
nr:hypothetical protein I308_03522 [Cryptococcus tetragattii IND107]